MMTNKHTPGPWMVTDGGVRDSGGLICSAIRAFRYPDQDERYEAEVVEREANARLIAAAPDLLAACRAAISAIRGREHDGFLRAVIAKATGAAPAIEQLKGK